MGERTSTEKSSTRKKNEEVDDDEVRWHTAEEIAEALGDYNPLAEHLRLAVYHHRFPARIFDTGFDAFDDAVR